jgi:hypothetical protein
MMNERSLVDDAAPLAIDNGTLAIIYLVTPSPGHLVKFYEFPSRSQRDVRRRSQV